MSTGLSDSWELAMPFEAGLAYVVDSACHKRLILIQIVGLCQNIYDFCVPIL